MAQILKESDMRDLEAQLAKGEITYSRMLELIEEKVLDGHISKDAVLAELEDFYEWPPHCLSKYLIALGWICIDCFNDYTWVWENIGLNKTIIAKVNHIDSTPFGMELIHSIWHYDGIYSECDRGKSNISPKDFIDEIAK